MKLQIPIGSEISAAGKKEIRIRVANTKYFVQGERKQRNTWNLYLIEPGTTYKELIKENMSTLAFSLLSNITLKTPFPYVGKKTEDSTIIKKFINKLIKINIYDQRKRNKKRNR